MSLARHKIHLLFATCLLAACDARSGSHLGKLGFELTFPMYIAGSDRDSGIGVIYEISGFSRGSISTPTVLLSDLNFPAGVAVDRWKNIYFSENIRSPGGDVKVLRHQASSPDVLISNLHYPDGIAVDSFGKVYVAETSKNQVTRYNQNGDLELTIETPSPKALFIDAQDQLYVSEVITGAIWKFDADGNGAVISPQITLPFAIAMDSTFTPYVLANNTGEEDGQVFKLSGNDSKEEVIGNLINPEGLAFDAEDSIYVLEGYPAKRVLRYSQATKNTRVIAEFDNIPKSIAFTPY